MDDDIVEKFLMEQLDAALVINEQKKKSSSNCKLLLTVQEECRNVKDLMEQKKLQTGAALKHTRRENLYYLLNVLAEWLELLQKKTHVISPCQVRSVVELHGKLNQIKKHLDDAAAATVHQDEKSPKLPEMYRWSCQAVGLLTKFHGFEDKGMIMERLLLAGGSKAVGIVGVAGVGKTALCQLAFNHGKVQNHFLLRIWLCLSRQRKLDADDEEEILVKRILSCLGFPEELIRKLVGLKELQLALRHQLKRGRYLIVLDDVWTMQEDGKIGASILNLFSFLTQDQDHEQSGALIVTSRYEELQKMVATRNMHRLLPLAADKNSCWNIFTDAFDFELPDEMKKLKDKIVDNCEGLPLMAKMLGQIARNKY